MQETRLAPIVRHEGGYLPLEDYGLIGDGTTTALIGRDGAVAGLCLPRADSPPLFCQVLDHERGGAFTLAPEGLRESRQYYEEDTAVLVTEMRTDEGRLRIRDALTLKSGADLAEDTRLDRSELVRVVEVLSGRVRLRVTLDAFGGARIERGGAGYRLECPNLNALSLQMYCSEGLGGGLPAVLDLEQATRVQFGLTWGDGVHRHRPVDALQLLERTGAAWRRWLKAFAYDGPRRDLVRRSAITLKLLDYAPNGAIRRGVFGLCPAPHRLHAGGVGVPGLGDGRRRAQGRAQHPLQPGRRNAGGGVARRKIGGLPPLASRALGQRGGGPAPARRLR
jgi:GH15 family glucan-1,4-alpha-glucosidase